jgi:hypothetical protein
MINWLAEKEKKDQRDMALRATAGDTEALKDLDYLIQPARGKDSHYLRLTCSMDTSPSVST